MVTASEGPRRVIVVGQRALPRKDLARRPDGKPVHFPAGAIGNTCVLRVSPQHAVRFEIRHGGKVLVRAKHLDEAGFGGSRVAKGVLSVCYHHVLLDRHAVLCSAGAAT